MNIPFLKKIVKKIIRLNLLDKDGYFNRALIESFIDERMVSGIVEQKINEFDLRNSRSLRTPLRGRVAFYRDLRRRPWISRGAAESFISLPH